MHKVLVNPLGGLSLPRKSVVRFTDRPDMTLDVYRGRKTTNQQQQQINNTVQYVQQLLQDSQVSGKSEGNLSFFKVRDTLGLMRLTRDNWNLSQKSGNFDISGFKVVIITNLGQRQKSA